MTTIPTLNVPAANISNKADFGTLGDLANTYRSAQQQKQQNQYQADAGDLAKRGYAVQMGLSDPGAANSTTGNGGWLSNLMSYIGIGGQQGPRQFSGTMIPQSNVVTPTMTAAIPQGQVPLPMARPQTFG